MSSYRQIDLNEWVLVGEGYNGQAYVSKVHPDVMLKLVLRELGSASNVEKEFLASKTAYELRQSSSRLCIRFLKTVCEMDDIPSLAEYRKGIDNGIFLLILCFFCFLFDLIFK